ncbi:perilipin-3-like [Trichosurus vulpecula]|uniref:perilipin-3-like n=1 Tax=Trichosurus vulpecula TaxID=9337 RepID=UPI00186AF4D9|nr:perilipin-3-like [Trichosurus vulpecula]
MDHISTIGKETLHLAETRTSPSQTEKTVPEILIDAKEIVARITAKASSEPINQERMSIPQVPQEIPPSSKEIIPDKAQPSKESDSLLNASSGYSSKDDAISISNVSTRSVSNEEKILSGIQEEKQTLEQLKMTVDKYFPLSPNEEEDGGYFGLMSSKGTAYFTSLGSLPSHLQPQAYKHALENIRGAKNNMRNLSYHLYEAIEWTYQRRQGSEDGQNRYMALLQLWIKWSRSLSENVDGSTKLLEIQTLAMSRIIALKFESDFRDLMCQVQGLSSSIQIQDKLQQVSHNMHELYTTLSLNNRFEDLDQHHLAQLTQAQGIIEELFCFLEGSIPSG